MTLELPPDQMRAMADEVAGRCIEFMASLPRQPSAATWAPRRSAAPCASRRRRGRGARSPPRSGCSTSGFRGRSPRPAGYLAYIPGGGLFPAALADFIANDRNRYTGVWQAAPALVQLEANALDWLRDWMDFPATTRGLFTTGGSMANFNAILCARERHLGADIRRGVLYTSDQVHHSVMKSAKLAGIMPDRVRRIPVDARFRHARRRARRGDRATIGAPGCGRSWWCRRPAPRTPARSIRSTRSPTCAPREGLWHHVDGAYGAFFHAVPRAARPLLAGCRAPTR